MTSAPASAVSAAATWAAVLVTAPAASVARLTRMALPVTVTASGRSAAPGSASATVMSLPPSCPQASESTATRVALVPPSTTCALRRYPLVWYGSFTTSASCG